MAADILTQLANPETMKTLSFSQKMWGGVLVTVFGMGITFISLVTLQFIIYLLAKLTVKTEKTPMQPQVASISERAASPQHSHNEEELIAVVSAAVAMMMQRSTGEIRIRHIRKIEEPSSWNRTGMLEQMNTRL